MFRRARETSYIKTSTRIFTGYSIANKAYKIFQPLTKNVVVSRDVHFVEDEEWN